MTSSMARVLGPLAVIVSIVWPTAACAAGQNSQVPRTISLAGEWRFLLDPRDTGVADRIWQTVLPDRIRLPGSTDQARIGVPNTRPETYQRPGRLVEYAGAAWYQRDIVIPFGWRRRRITLFLERCHWETRVWLDGKEIGSRDSLSTPHVYDLTGAATAGRHRLTIRVDNRLKYDIGAWANAVSEESQTNWNGIIGRIELRGTARVWIEDVRTYPDIASSSVKVRVRVGNVTGRKVRVALTHTLRGEGERPIGAPYAGSATCDPGFCWIEHTVPVPSEAGRWDEFTPQIIELATGIRATHGRTTWVHGMHTTFGMRSIGRDATHFLVNGRRVFLRGSVECGVFPLTGYPPTDVDTWNRIFSTARAYGLNHMRFHTWCPPEAAFVAADRHGFLLQVEAPFWTGNVGKDPARDRFIREEMLRILDTYGSHPSFAMFRPGHELTGDAQILNDMVKIGRAHDPRHLYASSSESSLGDRDDFSVAALRGPRGARTDHDHRQETPALGRPVIAHEIGQWAIFPDIRDIGQYVGVTRAGNLVRIQRGLEDAGLLPYACAIVNATGRAAVELAKEEIEAQLRNPSGAGFQWLSLQDHPGRGTAAVGLLNAFRVSKGLITPEQFRRFCSPTVPLARLARRTFLAGENLAASLEIAHYGPRDLDGAVVEWSIRTDSGKLIAAGDFEPVHLPTGRVTRIGLVSATLAVADVPGRLTFAARIRGAAAENSWSVWVYPRPNSQQGGADKVMLVDEVSDRMLMALRNGQRVVLMGGERAARRSIKGSPTPVFWSPILFPDGPNTMGVFCDPHHAALRHFPTDAWTDWQWWEILERSRSMVIADGQAAMEPVVRILDNFARNLPLALVAQCRVGSGRLLVVGADLQTDLPERPAAAQLRRSLMEYAASDDFDPTRTLTEDALLSLFPHPSRDQARGGGQPPAGGAALHVRAAVALDPGSAVPWSQAADAVVQRAAGYDYRVAGRAFRDDTDAGWRAASELRVVITVPAGFAGLLAVRFHDATGSRTISQVWYEDRFVETLTDLGPNGMWLRIPVSPEDSADGEVVLLTRPEGANAVIAELLLRSAADGSDGRQSATS